MPSLVEFLLARIAEDEADAQALADTDGGSTWTAATDVGDHYNFGVVTTADPRTLQASYDGDLMISGSDTVVARCGIEGRDWDDAETRARHIARHDPARVLADCRAKQAIVELHRGGHECSEFLGDGSVNGAAGWFDADYNPCTTLRLLAPPFASHEDYDPAWATA